jgi:hypothetical protein
VTIASIVITAAAFSWLYVSHRRILSKVPDLIRLSPDDGHSYSQAAISPDGGMVAYVSNRSGKNEL